MKRYIDVLIGDGECDCDCEMQESSDGPYMKVSDHLKELEQLRKDLAQAQRERLQYIGELGEAHAEREGLQEELAAERRELARVKEELERVQSAYAQRIEELGVARRQLADAEDKLAGCAESNDTLREELEDHKLRLDMMALMAERARPVLEACEALVISTDVIGPMHLKGKPQIIRGAQCVAEAEWARRQAQREGGGAPAPAPEWDHGGCHSGRDGECNWKHCPQLRDGEPGKSGRHCPRDNREDDDG